MATEEAVPVVDLQLEEGRAAEAVRQACTTSGFFYAVNHGVPQGVIEAAFSQQRRLFALPIAEKQGFKANENNRGWTRLAEETLDPGHQSEPDTKEGYYLGREVPEGSPEAALPLHGPNVWPPESLVPGYRAATEAYFEAVTAAAKRLLRLFALALGLQPDHFGPLFARPMLYLRPLHYTPRVSDPSKGVFGCGAHSDYGALTLLRTDESPGLQILHRGAWRDVALRPDAFIVNVGDLMERWTNGAFKSTVHRVVSTSGRDRYSIAFFVEPNFDAAIECLPTCCGPGNPPRYPPITAGEHILGKYAQTHADYDAAAKTGPVN